MNKKKVSPVFRLLKWLARFVYPKFELIGTENLPDGPCIVVGNHAKTNGPVACELYFPGESYIWCAGEMMHAGEVQDYAFGDFWRKKAWYLRWVYKLASYLIVPLSVAVFNSANVIGVYHDSRVMRTFRETVEKLCGGARVVIFPEHDAPHNHIVCDFQDRFVDVARMYFRKTGKDLSFVPMYVAPRRHALYFGAPIRFDHSAPIDAERRRICGYLMDAITQTACALPPHTVVPYPNVPKRAYPTNIPKEASFPLRKIVVDYREFRFSRLNEPRFSHVKLLGGWIVYFFFFFLTENFIPIERCHVIHGRLDDVIPFNEYFAVFYFFWYVLLVFSLLYFFLYDVESFKRLQIYIIITQIVAMLAYILYPSVQLLRPAVMPRDNFFCDLMAFVYSFDTPTGVCPSLHVAYSLGIASVWLKYKPAPKAWKAFVVFSVVMISLSTCFVKQHSTVDVAAALPVCLLAEYLVYGSKPEFRRKHRLLAYLEEG